MSKTLLAAALCAAAAALSGCVHIASGHESVTAEDAATNLWVLDLDVPNVTNRPRARERALWKAQDFCSQRGGSAQLLEASAEPAPAVDGLRVRMRFRCVVPFSGPMPELPKKEEEDKDDGTFFGIL